MEMICKLFVIIELPSALVILSKYICVFGDCRYEALFATAIFSHFFCVACLISNFLLVTKTLKIPTKKLVSLAAHCGIRFA